MKSGGKNRDDASAPLLGLAVAGVVTLLLAVAMFGLWAVYRARGTAASLQPDTGGPTATVVLPTSTPTLIPAPTRTPRYTPIPNLSANDAAYSLPPAPKGFSWKVIPDLLMDTLVPDGWYFEQGELDDVDVFYVTKEKVDEDGSFTTGMFVKVFRNTEEVDQFAQAFISDWKHQASTLRVVDSFRMESPSKTITMYSILIEVENDEFEPDNPNFSKKMVCNAIADPERNNLYLMTFESPKETWKDEWNLRGGPITLSVINLLFAGR